MKFFVIIVNYNVKYFFEQAFFFVGWALCGLEVEMWVVDNNFVDDFVCMVQEKFFEVYFI